MRLIINADDMGRSDIVNHSIINMHQKGVVSSTTLMANSPQFNEAVNLLAGHPELGVGVHLCLDGPYQSHTDYKTLIDNRTGSFYEKEEVIKRIRNSTFDKEEVYTEFCLQLEKILDHGIKVSHLDSHHHLHLYFPILSQVIRVAKKHGISFVRSQRLNTCIPKGRINKLYRYVHHLYLNIPMKSAQGYYDPAMQECADFDINMERLERMLNSTKGIMEIMVHPLGEEDAETNFFSSPQVQDLLSGHKIINYQNLK